MSSRHFALALLVASGFAAAEGVLERPAQDQTPRGAFDRPTKDPTARIHTPDPIARRGIEEARASLEDFLAKARTPAAGTSGYALRVAVQDGRELEHFWVTEFQWSDDAFSGRITGEPLLVGNVKPGQVVRFSRRQIIDWRYIDEVNGRIYGNYTAQMQSPAL